MATARFIGGPIDGEVRDIPKFRRYWKVPGGLPEFDFRVDSTRLAKIRIHTYEQVDVHNGVMIYEYRGVN